MLIMDLRDHLYAKGDYLLGKGDEEFRGDVINIPLVGDQPGDEAVIDYDVLWSCTTCGACVEECPVDIQHVDTIVEMRRYKAMMESSFPQEAGVMLRNVENSGDPWGVGQSKREEWTEKLDFDIPRRPCPAPSSTPRSSTSSGSAAPARSTTAPRRSPRPRPSCCTTPA